MLAVIGLEENEFLIKSNECILHFIMKLDWINTNLELLGVGLELISKAEQMQV